MLPLLLAVALAAPWRHPVSFSPLAGWRTGASGTTRSTYVGRPRPATPPVESTAWAAKNVRYRDEATADPPNRTLARLPANGVIVWAVIFSPPQAGDKPIRLVLGRAKHFACCEGEQVVGGEYELTGSASDRAYSVIVRIYFGSRPSKELRADAQLALTQLRLPERR